LKKYSGPKEAIAHAYICGFNPSCPQRLPINDAIDEFENTMKNVFGKSEMDEPTTEATNTVPDSVLEELRQNQVSFLYQSN